MEPSTRRENTLWRLGHRRPWWLWNIVTLFVALFLFNWAQFLLSLSQTQTWVLCAAIVITWIALPLFAVGRTRQELASDRLAAGLSARRKPERDFIRRVVQEMHAGHLPRNVVNEIALWSRQRAEACVDGRARRPILYFQTAMEDRARAMGVLL